ncbi:alanine racemase [Polymorphobacter glacialis]|uniref:Alanine racemase n=1 Tax=Sandarakinorhabdus glacialis TaxID=1614636 RepID=A0A916ZYI4_9SPHN|nr:alanine racemase [Polymorphobacter glacialis]GGE18537.1 alanine racemase [Polymorphobacter glacialis]
MQTPPPNAFLTVDTAALAANWRVFAAASGPADCGAAIKANGYGLGAREVADTLTAAGCRDLFVAQWQEVAALGLLPQGVRLAVLHGADAADIPFALSINAVPVLVTPAQVAAWKSTGRPCDVMIDTGLNRLGLAPADALSGLLDNLEIHTLHSHLACSEDRAHQLNETQRRTFAEICSKIPARRLALANSAGIGLGAPYHLGLTRPGIGLYGGGQSPGIMPLQPVAALSARILQIRDIAPGACVGYGATFTAARPTRLATTALGYADGYPRALSNHGRAHVAGIPCPLVGRVSMDLTIFDVTDAPQVAEGSFLDIDFDLAETAAASGHSEYELLTGLGARYARIYR